MNQRTVPFIVLTLALGLALCLQSAIFAQDKEGAAKANDGKPRVRLLWPNGAPQAVGEEDADKPSITIYLPIKDKATGTGIVICPGGGYGHLAMGHEGRDIAKWLNSHGIAAFVLKYRIAKRYHNPAPLQDVRRAIRTVRYDNRKYGIDRDRIGVMGFSAGGHLASTAGTNWLVGNPDSREPIQAVTSRPDFMVLCYPVISFTTQYTHKGSRNNLLGKDADEETIKSFSSELQVTKDTPPTFLFHTDQDSGVPPENSVLFYLALRKHKVPAELHIYRRGRHGLGLARSQKGTNNWSIQLKNWMDGNGWLTPREKSASAR